jgi:hypothetical protein
MSKYGVKIIERLIKHIEVEAESAGDAETIARDQYNNGIHVLICDDFFDVDFEVKNEI